MGGVRIRIETRILHVIGEVPEYDLSVTAVEQADEKGTDCFQFQIDAAVFPSAHDAALLQHLV